MKANEILNRLFLNEDEIAELHKRIPKLKVTSKATDSSCHVCKLMYKDEKLSKNSTNKSICSFCKEWTERRTKYISLNGLEDVNTFYGLEPIRPLKLNNMYFIRLFLENLTEGEDGIARPEFSLRGYMLADPKYPKLDIDMYVDLDRQVMGMSFVGSLNFSLERPLQDLNTLIALFVEDLNKRGFIRLEYLDFLSIKKSQPEPK